jgi:excisionase family DNA binding protein
MVYKDHIRKPHEFKAKDSRQWKYHPVGKDPGNYLIGPKAVKQKGIHPAKMPDYVAEYLVKYGSKPGDIVLDPFCGSGTTLITAQALDRRFIGCDLNPDYVKLAKTRLKLNLAPVASVPAAAEKPVEPVPAALPAPAPVPPAPVGEWIMTTKELGGYLGLAEATVYDKISSGEIPTHKLGQKNRFKRVEIDLWLRARVKVREITANLKAQCPALPLIQRADPGNPEASETE